MAGQGSMADVMKFFDMRPGDFKREWSELSDQDKADLKTGLGNGTLTY